MNDFRAWLQSHGYSPPSLVLDGALHRFDRNGTQNAWLIGWQNQRLDGGGVYIVAMIGDWKTREEFTYAPKKISNADQAAIKKQIEECKKKQAEAKRLKQEDAAQKSEKRWASSIKTGTTAYLDRKQIPELFGAGVWNDVLQVPCRDISGRLWGIQYVQPDGSKRFTTGQRINGCFHVLGGTLDGPAEIYLAEGFATAASVHLATGKVCVAAFNAGNLAEVAREIKGKYPAIAITIAGDDDRFTPKNAGREAADKAALMAMGGALFPRFLKDDGKPTDWNDLHCLEGIDVVRTQLAGVPAVKAAFIPLGYDESTYFFYHVPSRDIVKVSTFSRPQLYQLAPGDYWEARYSDDSGMADWNRATDDLIQLSRTVGPFDSTRIRGTGVWLDDGRIVINTGHSLIVDGASMGLASIQSWYIYIQTRNRMPPLHSSPLSSSEAKKIVDLCQMPRWRNQDRDGYLLAGWLAIARIAGALPIRPHIWLTGSKGTGKSTVMEQILAPCLTPKGRVYLQGGSTEAGIRQSVKASSVPVIFDEFETTGHATKARVDAIIELFRNSWSATQGAIVKGSSGGHSVEYQLGFAGCVSSIRIGLENDADRSRFTVLELQPHDNDAAKWRAMEKELGWLTNEIGERLFSRMAGMVRTVLANQRALCNALAGVVSQRFGQQVGTLLAGWWALENDAPITDDQARAVVADLDLAEDKATEAEDADENECLEFLLSSSIDCGGSIRHSFLEVIQSKEPLTFACHLLRYGIKIKDGFVIIANKNAKLAGVFEKTRWGINWATSLARLPGAEKRNPTSFGRKTGQCRCVALPIELT